MAADGIRHEVFVIEGNSITAYGRASNGESESVRTISGDSTALVADPRHDELFVVNNLGDSISVHAPTAKGNVPPLRTVSGDATGLDSVLAMTAEAVHDEILVINGDNRIMVFARSAEDNAAPLRSIVPDRGQLRGRALVP